MRQLTITKFSFLTFLLLLSAAAPSWSKPMTVIEDLIINRNLDGNGVEGLNIRVNVSNQGHKALLDPTVSLWVRPNWQSHWRLVKKWDNHEEIKSPQKFSHDYFAYSQGWVDPAFFGSKFEVKAEVWSEGTLRAKTVKAYPDPK